MGWIDLRYTLRTCVNCTSALQEFKDKISSGDVINFYEFVTFISILSLYMYNFCAHRSEEIKGNKALMTKDILCTLLPEDYSELVYDIIDLRNSLQHKFGDFIVMSTAKSMYYSKILLVSLMEYLGI